MHKESCRKQNLFIYVLSAKQPLPLRTVTAHIHMEVAFDPDTQKNLLAFDPDTHKNYLDHL